MQFTTPPYFIFLIAVFFAFWLTKPKWRIGLLLLASGFFYAQAGSKALILLTAIALSDFFLARFIHRSEQPRTRKLLLLASLFIDVGTLCFFKYAGFFNLNIIVLLGLSFFIFQSIAYVVDVYRRTTEPAHNLLEYFEIYFLVQPGGGEFDVDVDGKQQARVTTASNETRSGFHRVNISPGAHTLTIKTIGNGEVRIFGVVLESGARGVQYDSLGVNGVAGCTAVIEARRAGVGVGVWRGLHVGRGLAEGLPARRKLCEAACRFVSLWISTTTQRVFPPAALLSRPCCCCAISPTMRTMTDEGRGGFIVTK